MILWFSAIIFAALLISWLVIPPALAHGQPASGPASLPAIPVSSPWLLRWLPIILGAAGWLAANLATALSDYPQAKDATTGVAKAIRFLRLFAALVSAVHFQNTGGSGLSVKLVGAPVRQKHLNP